MEKFLLALIVVAISGTIYSEPVSRPIVVELYTSQGCSSCPSADRVLSGWGRERFLSGEVIPLAFHVDYWDYIGWKDPFSSPDFTVRQRRYAETLKQNSVYTPQLIVQGLVGFVGSDGRRAAKEVEFALRKRAKESTDIQLSHSWRKDLLQLNIKAKMANEDQRLFLAVFENDLLTSVRSGENRGEALKNDFVVREFHELETSSNQTRELQWNPSWKKGNCGVAVFIQNKRTLEISSAQKIFPL